MEERGPNDQGLRTKTNNSLLFVTTSLQTYSAPIIRTTRQTYSIFLCALCASARKNFFLKNHSVENHSANNPFQIFIQFLTVPESTILFVFESE